MFLAFIAVGVIAAAADYGLNTYAGFSAEQRTTGSNVRLD